MADAKKEPEKVKLLGKELELTVKSGGDAVVTMRKGDFDDILKEKGVTKEVRDVVRSAHDAVVSEVTKFEKDYLLKANKGIKEDDPKFIKSLEARLGNGDGSMTIKMIPHKVHTGKDIKSGKPYTTHTYGKVITTLNYSYCQEMRKEGGELDQIAAAFEKQLGGK